MIKGSPADKAGLKAGDVIEYIDNKATRDISLYDARQMILGEPGTIVNLRVLRAGRKTADDQSHSRHIQGPAAGVAYRSRIRSALSRFIALRTAKPTDIRAQVQNFAKQGVQKIVLDLRGVATGSIDEGVAVANLFIKDGDLAKVIGRDNKVITDLTPPTLRKAVFDGKLAVLIDLGSAGAAEVVASALLERKRGEVVGERSFGSGTEQQLFTLRGGDGLLLTTAKWASASGTPFLGEDRATMGVKPSVEVKRPDTPEPIEVEDLIDQQDQQNQNPQPRRHPRKKLTSRRLRPRTSSLKRQSRFCRTRHRRRRLPAANRPFIF